jgi:RNA polymerase sigma factor (sigma-70 family)
MHLNTPSGADRFRALYAANHDRVYRLLGRVAGRQDAEDLTQIVFTKAARALPRFRGDARISSWLYRIAANVAADWLRGRTAREAKQTVQLPEVVEGQGGANVAVPDPQPSPEQRLIRKQMRAFIRGEIGRLPRANRAAGISLANAKVRLHRARAHLKTAIAARCDFYRTELSCAPNSLGCCPPTAPSSSAQTDHL